MVAYSGAGPNPPRFRDTKPKTIFDEFLISEYNNIAQAFFNTVNSISEFFKHYIVIVSLPISIAVIFLKPAELKASGILRLLKTWPLVPACLMGSVALIGLSVLGYVISLRSDAILYARAVNGIRRYFYDVSGLSLDQEIRVRVLPKSTQVPRYFEPFFFLFVVLTFALVGTAYFLSGVYFYWWANRWPILWSFWFLVASCFFAHLALYYSGSSGFSVGSVKLQPAI